MSLKNKAIKGIAWSFLEKWGGQLISTSVFLLLARLLTPDAFGLVALASVFISFMSAFVNQGFVPAIVQKEELSSTHLDTAFWCSLFIGLMMYLVTLIFSGRIANLFGEPELQPVIKWLALIFILIAFESVQTAILQRSFDFKKLAIRSLVTTFFSGVTGVIMAFFGFGVWSLVAQQLVNRVLNVLVLWRASSWRPKLNFSLQHFKEISSFGVNVMGVKILKFFNQRSDDFLIGLFLGTTALGYYTVAYRLLRLMVNILSNTTSSVALPAFSRLQNNPKRLRKAFYRVTQITSFVSFPVFLSVFILTPQIVSIFFGEKWLASIPVMRILVFVGILQSISYFNGTVMMAKGKPDWKLKLNFINALVNVVGFMIAVKYGIVAVAIAVVISNYLVSPIGLLMIKKLIGIKLSTYFRQYLAPLAGSIVMSMVMFGVKNILVLNDLVFPIPILLICGLSGAIAYVLTVFTLEQEMSKQILQMVKQFAK